MDFFLLFIFFALGAMFASFTGVIAERVNTGHSWLTGRSRCNSCGKPLKAHDLVPVLSWLLSFGRCRSCGSKIPAQYVVFEVILGALFAYSYYFFGLTTQLFLFLVIVVVLAFIVLYDLRHTIVPPPSSILLVVLSLLYAWVVAGSLSVFGITVLYAAVIALMFLALYVFSKGKAMGLGDTPVAFALSLVAAPYAFSGLLYSFWIGALFGIYILVTRRGGPKMGIEVPFVPFMAIGFLLAYFIQWNPFLL